MSAQFSTLGCICFSAPSARPSRIFSTFPVIIAGKKRPDCVKAYDARCNVSMHVSEETSEVKKVQKNSVLFLNLCAKSAQFTAASLTFIYSLCFSCLSAVFCGGKNVKPVRICIFFCISCLIFKPVFSTVLCRFCSLCLPAFVIA